MKYNLKNQEEVDAAADYLAELMASEAYIDIKPASDQRSGRQNRYIHALFGIYGLETGYTREEAKTIFKRVVNPDIFVYDKNGMKFLKSTADLDKIEIKTCIDRFLMRAAEQGIELPTAEDTELLRHMEERIRIEGKYL